MALLVCDICGGKIVVQAGGQYGECDSCGANYTLERMREIANGIKVSVTGTKEDILQWIELVGTYIKTFDFEAAEKTVKKILEAEPTNAYANDVYEKLQDWRYFEIKNGVLAKYHGKAAHIEVPKGVCGIGKEAFQQCTCTDIILPDSVTFIEETAFTGCLELKNIKMPNTLLKIGSAAFKGCTSIENIVIPGLVTEIREFTFCNCAKLKDITIPEGVTKIGEGAFLCCSSLTKIIIPHRVQKIERSVFTDCTNLEQIVLPKGITEIHSLAFSNCINLKTISLPDTIIKIELGAFEKCSSLENIILPPKIMEIPQNVFNECYNLKQITIPEGVIKIHDFAFGNCLNMKIVNIPNSVRWMGNQSFFGCSLEHVNMSDNLLRFVPDYGVWHQLRVRRKQRIEDYKKNQDLWRKTNVCQHCGGRFRGIIHAVCTQCGKPRDY